MLILALILSTVAGKIFAAQPMAPTAPSFDPTPWQEDFSQLLTAMSRHYANLEWAIKGRHMDLVKLRETTEAKLNHARSDTEARAIFDKFVDAFGDGHLQIVWPETPTDGAHPSSDGHQDLCQHLGYSSTDNRAGIDFQYYRSSPL